MGALKFNFDQCVNAESVVALHAEISNPQHFMRELVQWAKRELGSGEAASSVDDAPLEVVDKPPVPDYESL